ncbi:MAG: cytochrome c3 family protein [Elusimicrobiota bacterium]|nr:cytochrome c3 family protein [Elusimicrobiota bacterium]
MTCLIVLLCAGAAHATSAEECLGCHSDKDMSVERKGSKISLFVDEPVFSKSVHASMGCTGCHEDAENPPHPEGLKEVRCAKCHEAPAAKFAAGIHGKALKKGEKYAPKCHSCHGKHDIRRSTDHKSATYKLNIPALCGTCHREGAPVALNYNIHQKNILENYKESIHGEGLFKKGLLVTATCNDCHNSHDILPHTDPKSSISMGNVAGTCARCHASIEEVHKKIIRGELWESKPGAIPACTDCHAPHTARKGALVIGMANQDCMKCHQSGPKPVKLGVFASSVHGKISCVKCHSDVNPKHKRPCDTAQRVDCASCHAERSTEYAESIHGQLFAKKDAEAPYCTDCHGTHNVLPRHDDRSPIARRNIPGLCANCHRDGEQAAKRYKGDQKDIVGSYMKSTHGKGVMESGLVSSAVCVDCHTSHRELPASDDRSSVNKANLSLTCAKCHKGIYEKFSKSIHSPFVSKTREKLPVCADCHSAHKIARVEKDKFQHEVLFQCGSCHKDVSDTYFLTYHGKAFQLGSKKSAKCSDCHGAHDILPTSNPASLLSRDNVISTCAKCHPGANRQFTGYLTHATHHNRFKYPILFFTFWSMTLLLIGTFAFFGVHTLLWLPQSFKRLKEKRAEGVQDEPKQFVRFGLQERLLHLSVIISFFGLAITGMMVKFANMAWASFLADLVGGVAAAGAIHRICAVITFGYFAVHLYGLFKYKKEKGLTILGMIFSPASLVPSIDDFWEFVATMKWFVGKGPRPQYGRWTYWEKFDYFAVFWGVAIIGSTGLILWFPEAFTRVLPGWVINVATIIHSDEALLAAGFIFTIHFFNTHLRPDAFPMDPVIFTGYTSLSELKHDRPREYEELKASGELEKRMTTPVSKRHMKLLHVFGLTCLTVGITLVILIIYSMLFGYH